MIYVINTKTCNTNHVTKTWQYNYNIKIKRLQIKVSNMKGIIC